MNNTTNTSNNPNNPNNPNNNLTYWMILRAVLGVAALILIIISMITDRHNAFLTTGLCCIAISNVIGWKTGCKRYNCFRKQNTTED